MTTAKPKKPTVTRAAQAAKEAANLMSQSTKQEPNFFLTFLKKYREDPVGFVETLDRAVIDEMRDADRRAD